MTRTRRGDSRGFLERIYCDDELGAAIGSRTIRQINRTSTENTGTLRGLHFQHPPCAELKIVTCLNGKIFDVAVDLRKNSPTFLSWHAQILESNTPHSLIIPEGCAHGFQTLSPACELLYFHTAPYTPSLEAGLNPMDPRLAIEWPLPVAELSPRDSSHPLIDSLFSGLTL